MEYKEAVNRIEKEFKAFEGARFSDFEDLIRCYGMVARVLVKMGAISDAVWDMNSATFDSIYGDSDKSDCALNGIPVRINDNVGMRFTVHGGADARGA